MEESVEDEFSNMIVLELFLLDDHTAASYFAMAKCDKNHDERV